MPFFLYRVYRNDYVVARKNITLAGSNTPFCRAARCTPSTAEWELDETNLLRSFDVDPAQHAVVIDLKPRMKDQVSLYRLKHVWGYSEKGWTPLALQLEALYVDEAPPQGVSVVDFKKQFPALGEPGDQIYEFLYLNGDGTSGTWSFGRVGSVNAPLLWAEVLDSFIRRINRKRREKEGLPPLGVIGDEASV